MISYEYIQFLNERVVEYLPADRMMTGNSINFRCPICGDSAKSTTKKRGHWYTANASYYCFNCGASLSGIKFLEYVSGKDYSELRQEYIRLFLKSGLNTSLSSDFDKTDEPGIFQLKPVIDPEWKKPLSVTAREYLNGRRVLDAPFRREDFFTCTSAKNPGLEYILIPWVINGLDVYYQLNDFKHIHDMKYVFPKNKKKLIYGLDNVDVNWKKIIVFEGVYDSLFVKNGIATGTKAITQYQLKLIHERYPNHEIVVSFDNDIPGLTSMVKLIKKDAKVKFFRWFNKNTKQKDINDYVLAKNDVRAFTSPKILEKMIVDPLQMKWWLIENGLWNAVDSNPGQIIAASKIDTSLREKKNLLSL